MTLSNVWRNLLDLQHHKVLLIYDNVESSDLIRKYWPVANQGCALITARNHNLAYEPAETGIEVLPFDTETGSVFVLHLLSLDIAADVATQESKSAAQLSERLGGYALAISQMAALIHRRSWTIEEFLAIYDRFQSAFFSCLSLFFN
ncbi:hypothetical protein M501DRAFT_1018761 [Patellaria atrata CBS 101060]|uniref:NB-ARC domain-containing protein n=1 Tax=Patellaria atrata CBS 101060 TaxID=1346257 RepID=A0A9P4S598_9PEZI|nr:hypothetical protein M501DRAFT_1018761 [Patellaria atrata CBS 101060]